MNRGANECNGEPEAHDEASHDSDSTFESVLRKAARLSDISIDPPLPRLGQVIGHKYRIETPLGRGGMGVVFRATHLVTHKAVALKWMLRSTSDATAHRRLLREALAAGRIDHPNVVDVYDVGQEDSYAYLVMELLHGESLRARLERGRLESEEAMQVLLPALRGVAAAHRAGVIHRDLKPDNIFLCTAPDGSAREAKVLDFGVSAVRMQSTLDPTLTDGATILGTPAYMSPEQLASAQDVDARTDVYAFGVILYEALTGQLPFVADSYSGLVLAVAHDPPKPPRAHRPELARELERVILHALAKRREDRPQTIDALLERLQPFARTAAPASARAPRPLGTRRIGSWVPVALAFAAALALLARAAYSLWHEDAATPPPQPSAAAPAASYLQLPSARTSSNAAVEEPAPVRAEPDSDRTSARAAPRSCEAARRAGRSRDGLLTIDPDGSGRSPAFEVYCANMSAADSGKAAREYLPLTPAPDANVTRFRYQGSACPCPDLTRRFTHVRLDPATLAIDARDGTFARYDRTLSCEEQNRSRCGESTNLAWAGAGSCRGSGDTSGSASIDLHGTPFAFAPAASFVAAGYGAAGSAIIAADRKSAQLTGGGLCGALVPEQGNVPLVIAP